MPEAAVVSDCGQGPELERTHDSGGFLVFCAMQVNDDILSLLREEGAQAARKSQRAVILQPGAIGDCILTLPLAEFMKDVLGLGFVDIFGHAEYIGIFPGRTCVDGISSIDSMELHRLFVEPKDFDLADRDPLINTFAGYSWITTFMGEPHGNFEQNLIYTANCSHSSDVITLPMIPPKGFSGPLGDFYRQQFINESGFSEPERPPAGADCLIRANAADRERGREVLAEAGVEAPGKLVIIHPGSGGRRKCWHLDNFLAVASGLVGWGIDVVFLLGPAEMDRLDRPAIKRIRGFCACLTSLSLTQVLGLLSCADGFVGNDSGIAHLAAALGTRTFVVFGPTDPAVYRPIGPTVTVLKGSSTTFSRKPSARLQGKLLASLSDLR